MSRTIDEKVVEMDFDNSRFESNVRTSMSTLDKLKASLRFDGISKGFDSIEKASSNVNFSGFSNSIETVHAKFSAFEIMAISALQNITNKAVDAGLQMVKSLSIDQIAAGWSKYEQKTQSVQTLVNSTGKSVEEINEYLDKLMWFSDETSYSFTEMVSALATMTSAGGDIDKLIPMIEGIANATAFAGKGASEFSRVIYNLNQSYSGGALTLMDWRSVQSAGVNSKQLQEELIKVGEELGTINKGAVTLSNFTDSLKDKWATTAVMEKAFTRFSALTEAAREAVDAGEFDTASEAIEALAGSFDDLAVRAFESAQEAKSFREAIESTKDAVSSSWLKIFEKIFGNYNEQKELWTDLANELWETFVPALKTINEVLTGWRDLEVGGRSDLIESLWNIFYAMRDLSKPIKEAFNNIFPELTSEKIGDLVSRFKAFTETLQMSEGTYSKTEKFFENIFTIVSKVSYAIEKTVKVLSPLASVAANIGKQLLNIASNALSSIANKLNDISSFNSLIDFLNTLSEIADNVSVKVEKLFEGIIYVSDKAFYGIKKILQVLSPLGSALVTLGKQLYDIAGNTMDRLVRKVTSLDEMTIFDKFIDFLNTLSDLVAITSTRVLTLIDRVKRSFSEGGGGFAGILSVLFDLSGDFFSYVGDAFRIITGYDISGFVSGVVKVISSLKENIVSFINEIDTEKIAEKIRSIKDKLSDFREKFSEFFDKIKSIAKDGIEWIAEHVSAWTGPFETLKNVLEKILSTIETIFKKLASVVTPIVTFIGKTLGSLGTIISGIIQNADFEQVFDILGGGVSVGIGVEIATFVAQLSRAAGNINDAIWNLSSMLSSIQSAVNSWRVNKDADTLKTIALSIGILAVSLVAISSIDSDKIIKASTAISLLFGELLGSFAILSSMGNIGKIGKQMATVSSSIISLSIGILLLSVAVKSLGSLDWNGFEVGFAGLTGIFALVVAFEKIMSGTDLVKGASSLIGIAIAIDLLVIAVKSLGSLNAEQIMAGLLSIAALLMEIIIFEKMIGSDGLVKGTASLLSISVAIDLLSIAMNSLGKLDFSNIANGLVAIGGLLLEIGVFSNMMSDSKMISSGFGLIEASVALLAMSGALKVIGSINLNKLAQGVLAIGALLTEIAVASSVMGAQSIASGAGLIAFAAGVALLVPSLALLGSIDPMKLGTAILALAAAFTVLGVAGAVLAPITPAILGLSAALALIGVSAVTFGAGLLSISLALDAFAGSSELIINAIIEIITRLVTAIPDILTELANSIANSIPALLLMFSSVIVALLEAIEATIPKLVETVLSVLESILLALKEHFPTIISLLMEFLTETLTAIAEHLPDFVVAAINVALAFIDGLTQKVPDLIDSGVEFVLALINGIADAIEEHAEEIRDAAIHLGVSLLTALVTFVFGAEAGKKFKEFVTGVIDKIESAFGDIWERITKIGSYVIEGLVEGLMAGINWIKDTAKEIGQAVVDAFEFIFDEHSPSKVADRIARFFDLGLVNGFNEESKNVIKTAENIANKTVDSFENPMSKVAEIIDSTFDADPVIRPVMDLSRIQNGANQLFRYMNSISGYDISGTIDASSAISNNLDKTNKSKEKLSSTDPILDEIKKISGSSGTVFDNVFNVTGTDPKETAEEISRILQKQFERKDEAWA